MEDQNHLTRALSHRYRIDGEIQEAAKLPNPQILPHFHSEEAERLLSPKPLPMAHRSDLP